MPTWSRTWEVLFEDAALSPKLGVNFVQASAHSTILELPASSSSLVVGQDLAKHGIAGVVWNCVRANALDRARAMVSFLEAEPQLVAHRHVLELGAGPGAVGLALAIVSDVSSLLLSDLESVVPLTRSNARAAAEQHESIATLAASNRLDVCALRWGEPLDKAIATRSVDVVVASDCLYESASHAALLSTLLELTVVSALKQRTDVAQHHATVLLAYKQRMPAKEKLFFEAAANYFDVAIYSKDASGSSTSNNDRNDAIEYFDEAIYICKLEGLPNSKQSGSR